MSRETRRALRGVLALLLACASAIYGSGQDAQTQPSSDLLELSIAQMQERLAHGRETSRSLVQKYLVRIDAFDRRGPTLRSVIELNPDALDIADELDRERTARRVRGPLHGIPILLKDTIATGDRMMTSAGSLALAQARAPRDAFIAARLRAAGAVLLGKTNLSEWANFRSSHSSSGWRARGGQTKNPYALDRNPSGSSSGSAVAVAANLAAAAVGTETDGSIVSPASVNGIVGIKPTIGLLSRTGIVPISHSQDTAGPMARSVADAAVLLTAMAAADSADPVTLSRDRAPLDFATSLDVDGLRGARIGVVRNRLFGYSPAADQLAEAALQAMKEQGAVLVDPANIPTLAKLQEHEMTVLLFEFKADLEKFLAWFGPAAPVRSLRDVIAFNERRKDQELRYFGQELMLMADKTGSLTDASYLRALSTNQRLAGPEGIDAVMDRHDLDALVAPTFGPAWLTDLVNGDSIPGGMDTPSSVAAVAGYPHITVPMGFYRGLPIGLSFFGRAWSEPTLLKLAFAFEQATKHRRPPTFAATAEAEDGIGPRR